jgi:endonuclease/exonuclease/phosphatase family metal-dependent hydrolase
MNPLKRSKSSGVLFCVVCFLTILGAACTALPRERTAHLRVMTYNIRHGEGMDGRIDLGRIAEVIRREGADIVALQEVDRGVARSGRRDLAAELAELTGLTHVFSNNFSFQGGEYGNALLSRLPVKRWGNTHYRMLREGEQRGLLAVELDVAGQRLVVMSTHLDFRPDDAERLSNVGEIRAVAGQYGEGAVILCGDFNAVPGSPTHVAMKAGFEDVWESVGTGDGHTYSSTEPRRRIDYVFLRRGGNLVPVDAWVPESVASDHLPLVVEFRWRP